MHVHLVRVIQNTSSLMDMKQVRKEFQTTDRIMGQRSSFWTEFNCFYMFSACRWNCYPRDFFKVLESFALVCRTSRKLVALWVFAQTIKLYAFKNSCGAVGELSSFGSASLEVWSRLVCVRN